MSTFYPQNIDRYKCVSINLLECISHNPKLEDFTYFKDCLKCSKDEWKKKNINAIWFKIGLIHAHYIPLLSEDGFVCHHAKPTYIFMVNWVNKEKPNKIPPYPHTNIGVGAIVMDNQERLLLVQEKYRDSKPLWKFPGGYAEKGEELAEVAEREVFEETNVKTKFQSIVVLRHYHKFQFDCSDLYIVCHLNILGNNELKKDDYEIIAVSWIPWKEIINELSPFNKLCLERFLKNRKDGIKMGYQTIESIIGKVSVYSLDKDEDNTENSSMSC